MKKKIKQRINRWICKHFGHKTVEEIYSVRCDNLFGFPESNSKKAKYLYRIFIDERCERCGVINRSISSTMRRSELLKHELVYYNSRIRKESDYDD